MSRSAPTITCQPVSGAEVGARISAAGLRRAASSQATEDPIVLGDLVVDPAARRARMDGRELALSRKEFDLLAELARHACTVLTREQLMARVWARTVRVHQTLDVHMGWLHRRLGDEAATPRYLHTVRGVGFRLGAPEFDALAAAGS